MAERVEGEEEQQEASCPPEPTELNESPSQQSSDLSSQVQSLNQRSQEQETLLKNSQEEIHQIQADQKKLQEKLDQLTPQPSTTNGNGSKSNDDKTSQEPERKTEKKPDNVPQSEKPLETPEAEKPRRRRRSI
jgi:ABC-type transporter Mla subunit MlaD